MSSVLIAPVHARAVRTLLPREGRYVVTLVTLVASIASDIVEEQFERRVRDTVVWALATNNPTPVSGGRIAKSAAEIAVDVEALIRAAVGHSEISMRVAVEAVTGVLSGVYGRQARISGWLPGHRLAIDGAVFEILDDPCPSCTVNPVGFRLHAGAVAQCINRDDCGWTDR